MPLNPLGLGKQLYQKIKDRVRKELEGPEPPANTPWLVLTRVREAVTQDPPKLVHALYQRADAAGPTWRYLECYSLRDRGAGTLLYAWCSKDPVNPKTGQPFAEAFHLDRFHDMRVTDIPFDPKWDIEFHN